MLISVQFFDKPCSALKVTTVEDVGMTTIMTTVSRKGPPKTPVLRARVNL